MSQNFAGEMVAEIRLLWYFPSFELEGNYPGGYRTLALANALIRHGISHITVASILLKESRTISSNLYLAALPHNPLMVWESLRGLTARRNINVVQERLGCGYFWNGWGVLAAKQAGLPAIGELHEYSIYFKDKLFQYLPLKYALKNCDRFMIINNMILQHIPVTEAEKNKITLIPNGYDSSMVSETTSNQVELIRTLLPEKRKVIGYFGALTRDKGVDILLDSICSLKNQRFFFIITGHGPLENEVRAVQSRFPERMRFLGMIPMMDVYSLMSLCDATLALCPPEIRQGYLQFVNPLKVYESLAVGTEVVISEMVKNALPSEIANLCTVSKLKPSDILQALEITCNKNSNHPSEKRKVIDNYSWDSIAQRILTPLYIQACHTR